MTCASFLAPLTFDIKNNKHKTCIYFLQSQSLDPIPNLSLENKSTEDVLPFLWQKSMKLSYATSNFESNDPLFLKIPNLAKSTMELAQRSCPNPK